MSALPRRNQLVWVGAAAWNELSQRLQDPEALEILAHWHVRKLPLVVSRQPQELGPGRLALGLPAPLRWSRRRLALEVARHEVERSAAFPALRQVALHYGWDRSALALGEALEGLGGACQVYGSYGWQYLSGEAYLTERSDIDLCMEVPDFATAQVAVRCLQSTRLHRRVDGELVFPTGVAVAWREFAQLLGGQVHEVIVKSLQAPRLVDADELRGMIAPSSPAEPLACA